MNDKPLEVVVPVKSPPMVVSDKEAEEIMVQLGLIRLESESEEAGPPGPDGITMKKLLTLGTYIDGVGSVRLDRGAVMIGERVVLNHLLRLEAAAQRMTKAEDLQKIGYTIGYLAEKLAKVAGISLRAQPPTVTGPGNPVRITQPSFVPGQPVNPPGGPTVNVGVIIGTSPENGVAGVVNSA